MSQDFFNNRISICKRVCVRKSKHPQAFALKIIVTLGIGRLFLLRVMLATIKFNHQLGRWAVKIYNVVSDYSLTLESIFF